MNEAFCPHFKIFFVMENSSVAIQEMVLKMNLYLDNELPTEARCQLLKDIDENPTYQEIWQKEQSFRTFLKSNLTRRKPSSNFLENLRSKIQNDLS